MFARSTLVAAIGAIAMAGVTGCSGSSAPPAAAGGPASPATGAAVALPATPELRAELRRAYVAARPGMRMNEVEGPRQGTLYYALDRATRTYWAIAWFDPSPRASEQTRVHFQFGMGAAVFTRRTSGAWHASVHLRANLPCPGEVPPAVLDAWRLTPGTCTM